MPLPSTRPNLATIADPRFQVIKSGRGYTGWNNRRNEGEVTGVWCIYTRLYARASSPSPIRSVPKIVYLLLDMIRRREVNERTNERALSLSLSVSVSLSFDN